MTTTGTAAPATGGGPLRIATRVVAVLVVLVLLAAGWFGVSWYRAAHDDAIQLAQTREAVLRDARQTAINLNTLDHTKVDEGLDLWEQSSTGTVLDELRRNREAYGTAITDARTSSTAVVVDAAVADLDSGAGTARVLVGADVTYRAEEGAPSCVLQRLELEMKRVDTVWKVDQVAPVGTSTPVPGACGGAPEVDAPN
ncbi:MAG: hypothetical protein M3R63_22250 [Actinomycetota bacterium]|nr:hypothetical protein [Actinomycetota bacterium]